MSNATSGSGNPQTLIARTREGIMGDHDPCLFCFLYFFFECLLRKMSF